MSDYAIENRLREMRTQMKSWWARLTDADLDKASGRAEQIIAALQQRYNCTYEEAERDFHQRIEMSLLEQD